MPESTAAQGNLCTTFTSVLVAEMVWGGSLFHQAAGISDSSVLPLPQSFYKSLKPSGKLFFHANFFFPVRWENFQNHVRAKRETFKSIFCVCL